MRLGGYTVRIPPVGERWMASGPSPFLGGSCTQMDGWYTISGANARLLYVINFASQYSSYSMPLTHVGSPSRIHMQASSYERDFFTPTRSVSVCHCTQRVLIKPTHSTSRPVPVLPALSISALPSPSFHRAHLPTSGPHSRAAYAHHSPADPARKNKAHPFSNAHSDTQRGSCPAHKYTKRR